MNRTKAAVWAVLTALLLYPSFTSPAAAAVRYSYTGAPFTVVSLPYTPSMRLSGWFELDSPLAPNIPWPTEFKASLTKYSFSDGVNTLTESNSGFFGAYVATDALGAITQWELNLSGPVPAALNTPVDIMTTNAGSDDVDTGANCVQVVNGICDGVSQLNGASSVVHGAWSMDTIPGIAVPAMNGWGLLLLALLAGVGSILNLRRKTELSL